MSHCYNGHTLENPCFHHMFSKMSPVTKLLKIDSPKLVGMLLTHIPSSITRPIRGTLSSELSSTPPLSLLEGSIEEEEEGQKNVLLRQKCHWNRRFPRNSPTNPRNYIPQNHCRRFHSYLYMFVAKYNFYRLFFIKKC